MPFWLVADLCNPLAALSQSLNMGNRSLFTEMRKILRGILYPVVEE